MMVSAEDIISILNLKPLPEEGGYYTETHRSATLFSPDSLPGQFIVSRTLATAIYYLLTPETFSAMHCLPYDEIYHFYLGDTVEMLQLYPDGVGNILNIGVDLKNGIFPQIVVPKGVWQGSRLIKGGSFALLGTTVSPGFEFEDYVPGVRENLMAAYPEFQELIISLTRN